MLPAATAILLVFGCGNSQIACPRARITLLGDSGGLSVVVLNPDHRPHHPPSALAAESLPLHTFIVDC